MPVRKWVAALLLAGAVGSSAGCSSASVDLEDEGAYLKSAKADVPSASKYNDDDLVRAAERICYAGAVGEGAEIVADDYKEIAARDRERLAYLALTVGCPDGGG